MTRVFSWFSASGEQFDFTEDNGVRIRPGMIGVGVPVPELTTEARIATDGSALVNRRHGAQRMVFPLHLAAPSGATAVFDELAGVILDGPGTLRSDNGTRIRERLGVLYEGGLEGDESRSSALLDFWRQVPLSLVALDPWWYGPTETHTLVFSDNVDFDDEDVDFDDSDVGFDGLTPIRITVPGHAEAYPVIVLSGPFTTASVGNTGSLGIELRNPLADGSTLAIDTRPGNRGPRLNGGAVNWDLLTDESRLFTLPTGVRRLTAAVTGEESWSRVEVSFRPRWATP